MTAFCVRFNCLVFSIGQNIKTMKKIILYLCLFLFFKKTVADDAFTCCMAGWKMLKNIVICDAPCCLGYMEKVATPPLFKPVVYCTKIKEKDFQYYKGRRLTDELDYSAFQ
ncbi:uncharacterized protein [Centruroides vittatus]|uniref:uncharacterized protein n=1 Tax=Centruroides vittatus TaxID=120091 RepID=UPI00350FE5A8